MWGPRGLPGSSSSLCLYSFSLSLRILALFDEENGPRGSSSRRDVRTWCVPTMSRPRTIPEVVRTTSEEQLPEKLQVLSDEYARDAIPTQRTQHNIESRTSPIICCHVSSVKTEGGDGKPDSRGEELRGPAKLRPARASIGGALATMAAAVVARVLYRRWQRQRRRRPRLIKELPRSRPGQVSLLSWSIPGNAGRDRLLQTLEHADVDIICLQGFFLKE